MGDRVCLVTGATNGIGKVTARALAEAGSRVLIVARDRERGEATVSEIRSVSGNVRVELLLADLSRQADIRRLAAEVHARTDRLDVLVNNAGGFSVDRQLTVDGIEQTFAVNHLAYFLLTSLLIDLLVAGAPSRIVNVASDAHRLARLNLDDLQGEREYKAGRAYALSKLANVLFTRELARRLAGTGVTANAVHPGGVTTNIWNHGPFWLRWAIRVARPFMLTSEQGAEGVIRLATAPELDGVTGKYFNRNTEVEPSPAALDDRNAERLWTQSEALAPATGA